MKKSLLSVFFLCAILGSPYALRAEAHSSESSVLDQDSYTITGMVKSSDDGTELPGVTIIVKGTAKGTVTDLDGNYSISVSKDDILIYSYVGYISQEIPVSGKTVINVDLDLDIETLEEVVVVGYGEQKKANLTGAITSVDIKEIEDLPVANIGMALVGKMPGVQVNQSSGIPGSGGGLVIRGESASGMVRSVLYVIDGFIYSDDEDGGGITGSEAFSRLDPSEIESISILKDASAAVYGARGSGGVVLIKTKKGSVGKPKFNYSGSIGISQATQIPDMLSGYDHAVMVNEILRLSGARENQFFADDELELIKGRNYDWVDDVYQNGYTQRHALSVSGGTEDVTYFVGTNYYKETGNFEGLSIEKYGVRSNVSAKLSRELTLDVGLNINKSDRIQPYYAQDEQPGALRSWYKRLLTAPKWYPQTLDGNPINIDGSWNPQALLESNNYSKSDGVANSVSAKLNYDLSAIKGLKLSTSFHLNRNNSDGRRYTTIYNVYDLNMIGTNLNIPDLVIDETVQIESRSNGDDLLVSSDRGRNYQYNATVSYQNSFGKHNLHALLVYEQSEGVSDQHRILKTGSDVEGYDRLWAFSNEGIQVDSDQDESGRVSFIGRLNYDYDGKYLIESSFREEASQKFHPDNAWGFFPSVSMGWVMSEESFIKDNFSFVDFLKLRFSVGRVGNDNISPFQWKQTYVGNVTGPLLGTGGGTITNALQVRRQGVASPTITWGKVNSYNGGINLSLFRRKIDFSVDYYYNYMFDVFQANSAIPTSFGVEKPPQENYKTAYSKGIEYRLSHSGKILNTVSYDFTGVFFTRYSRPLTLYQNPAVEGTWVDERNWDDSNQPGYIALGIIRTDEDVEMVKSMYPEIDGQPIEKGMIYYKDVGGPNYSREPDGVLDGNDRAIIAKYTSAPYSYGFSFGFDYKSFKLSGTFSGQFGHKVFIDKKETVTPDKLTNVFAWWGDYWTEENTDAALPRPFNYGYEQEVSTFWMRDGHTLRLNNLKFSYAVPSNILKGAKIDNLRFYATATNLWTVISPFDFKDPSVGRAYDYPLARTISLGLNVSF